MPNEVEPLAEDAVSYVRRMRSIFLGDAPAGERLASSLLFTAVCMGSRTAYVIRVQSWWLFSAEPDWMMCPSNLSQPEAFFKLVPMAVGGTNTHRAEIEITAFSTAAFTSTNGDIIWIKQSSMEIEDVPGFVVPEGGRVVGYFID